MWLLITVLMTCSLHEVAESAHREYWPWRVNIFETVKESKQQDVQCLAEGSNGNDYRGTISVTPSGHTCLHWDRIQHIRNDDVSKGLGSHNYCRNPDNMKGPWCWIRGYRRKTRRYCDIPRCESDLSYPDVPDQDNEMTCGEQTQEKEFKIIGGSRASIKSQPWLASIFKDKKFTCGGTLIAPCWVLSATHCFPDGKRTKKEHYTVYLGKETTSSNNEKEQMFKVAKLVLHPDFDYEADDFNNDIALLQIQDSNGQCAQKTPSVRTACLPPAQQMIPYGSFCHIAGYGYEKNDKIPGYFTYSNHMKEAQVQILTPNVCAKEEYYGKRVTENQFCAASPSWTEDACQGDSGGPLVCEVNGRMFLFGVISWGEGCAKEFKPGVYTKVTNYNTWIAKETGLFMFTKGVMYPRKD